MRSMCRSIQDGDQSLKMTWHPRSITTELRNDVNSMRSIERNHKKWNNFEDIFCVELKLCKVFILRSKSHETSFVIFPWQHNRLQAFSIQMVKSEFPSFKKCYWCWCSFSECERILTLNGTSTWKSVREWSNKYWKGRGLVTSMLLWWHHNHYHNM